MIPALVMVRRFDEHTAARACSLARFSAGSRMATSRAMMATTTSTSISVKPSRRRPRRSDAPPVVLRDMIGSLRFAPSGAGGGGVPPPGRVIRKTHQ